MHCTNPLQMEGKMTENLLGNNYSCKGAEV